MAKKRVYIAGPDVFRMDWPDFAKRVQEASEYLGIEPVFPMSARGSLNRPNVHGITQLAGLEAAREIFDHCMGTLSSCDIVLANITPFRGDEPDSGTVFELATAYAIGKEVIGYTTEPRMTHHRHPAGKETDHHGLLCKDGFLVEKFNLPCNVMVACACQFIVNGDILDALQVAAVQKQGGVTTVTR